MCDGLFDWAFGDNENDLNEACYMQAMSLSRKSRLVQRLVFSLSTIDLSTRDSSIIFALQLLYSEPQTAWGVLGAEPPSFSI